MRSAVRRCACSGEETSGWRMANASGASIGIRANPNRRWRSGDFADGVLRATSWSSSEHVGVARLSVTRFNLVSGKVQTDEIGTRTRPIRRKQIWPNSAVAAASDKSKPGNIRGPTPHQIGPPWAALPPQERSPRRPPFLPRAINKRCRMHWMRWMTSRPVVWEFIPGRSAGGSGRGSVPRARDVDSDGERFSSR